MFLITKETRQIEMGYSYGGFVQYFQTVWISHNMGFDPIFLFNDLDDKGGTAPLLETTML